MYFSIITFESNIVILILLSVVFCTGLLYLVNQMLLCYTGRDKRPIKSMVVGRPILLALEDIDGGPSFLEKALRFLEKYGRWWSQIAFFFVVK